MREKHPLGRRLLALTAAVCTLGSLALAPAANAEQATPDKPVAQQATPSDPGTQQAAPQAGKADGVQKPETGTDTQVGNTGKPADTNTQQKPAAGNGDGGSADAAGQVIPLDSAHFPDAKFRGIVAKFDTNKDGKLSQAERDAVTEINAETDWNNTAWDLTSAKGVEYFPNLTSLNLSFTGITELDLSNNPKLNTLSLDACTHLTKLNITKNVNLKTLGLELAALASLELPSGDDQLKITNESFGDDAAPQLLAVRGGTFKGVFYSGRAVVGDSLDLAAATGFSADELKGHILVLPEGFLKDGFKAGNPQPFDGTVLKPAKGLSYMSYLYFPRLGDREKWIKNPDFDPSPVPFMIVHLGFVDPAVDQEWKDVVEADPSEFTPDSWNQVEEDGWKEAYAGGGWYGAPADWGYEQSKQGVWDLMKFSLSSSAVGDDGGGMTAAEWESNIIEKVYEVFPKAFRSVYRVTPIAPTRGTDSADVNVVTIPASARAVSYSVDGKEYKPGDQIRIPVDGQIVVKAKVKDGWTLAENLDASKQYWTFKWQSQTVAPNKPVQSGDVLTVSSVSGVEYYYTYDESGKDLQPFGNQTSIRVGGRPVWVVAKPAKGYQFAKDQKTVFGPYSYTAPNPPDNGGGNGGSGNNGNNGGNGGNGGTTVPSATIVDVERFYNPRNGEHFYTAGAVEQSVLRASGVWRDEGVAFRMSSDKGTPVYRLYNPGGKHLFTTSEKERDVLIKAKWNYEGVAFYVPDGAKTDVHRLYNPGNGDHLLTTSANERGVLVMHKWRDEGIAFKAE